MSDLYEFKPGKKFGSLTILNEYEKDNIIYYDCICDCGKKVSRKRKTIFSTIYYKKQSPICSKQCPCKRYVRQKISECDIPYTYVRMLKRGAKVRNYEFSLTIEYIGELFLKQGKKCKLSGRPISFDCSSKVENKNITASLDRIDSKIGYVEGNVQWLHKDVNAMKQDYSQQEFIKLCREVNTYQKMKEIINPS